MGERVEQQAALLEWVNDFAFVERVATTKDLSNGFVLWNILRDLDPHHFSGDLPSLQITDQEYWLPKWQNLNKIHRDTTSYLKEKCRRTIPRALANQMDLKAIAVAKDDYAGEIAKLMKLILLATILSPKANKYLGRMPSLSLPAQAAIRTIIQELPTSTNVNSAPTATAIDQESVNEGFNAVQDHELLLEEQLANLVATNKALSHEKDVLQEKFDDQHVEMKKLKSANETLQALGRHDPEAELKARELETKIFEQEDLIGRQELRLSKYESDNDALKRMVDNLRSSSSRIESLRDTCDELRVERDGLMRKANTVERYKQKLEALQNVELEAQNLRLQLEDTRHLVQSAEENSKGLEMTVRRYRQTLENVEQQNYDLQTVKRQLELDNEALKQRHENANEQNIHNEEVISSLRDRISELEGRISPVGENRDLSSQLKSYGEHHSPLEANLTEAGQRGRNDNSADSQAVMLQKLLEDANSKNQKLERLYLDAQERSVVLEHESRAISKDAVAPGSVPFLELRNSLQTATDEVSRLKVKAASLEADLLLKDGELSAVMTNLTLSDHSRLSTLHDTLLTKLPELNNLRHERGELHIRPREVQTDLDQQRSLLTKNLLDKDLIQKSLLAEKDNLRAAERSARDDKAALDTLKSITEEQWTDDKSAMKSRILELQETVERSKAQLAKHAQYMEKQDQTIKKLRDQLRKVGGRMDREEVAAKQKDSRDDELANLQRENALMTTAWYSLNSRLQLNNVELQRGMQEPRSWIKKQRQVVNNATVRLRT